MLIIIALFHIHVSAWISLQNKELPITASARCNLAHITVDDRERVTGIAGLIVTAVRTPLAQSAHERFRRDEILQTVSRSTGATPDGRGHLVLPGWWRGYLYHTHTHTRKRARARARTRENESGKHGPNDTQTGTNTTMNPHFHHHLTFCLIKNFWRTSGLFVGSLVPTFWTSGDAGPGFQSQGRFPRLHASSPACNGFLRFTSGATPADLLAAEPFFINVQRTCTLKSTNLTLLSQSGRTEQTNTSTARSVRTTTF